LHAKAQVMIISFSVSTSDKENDIEFMFIAIQHL
jgi:hypothetical protein